VASKVPLEGRVVALLNVKASALDIKYKGFYCDTVDKKANGPLAVLVSRDPLQQYTQVNRYFYK
jgi:hypothetical protein